MLASIIVGVYFASKKKASFCMVLVIFEFVIFVILFVARIFDPEIIANIYNDLAYSDNYLLGESAGYKIASNKYAIFPYNDFKILTIFTHLYLHSGPMHIISNMFFLVMLGIPFERKIGWFNFAIIFFVCGFFASLFSSFFSIYYGDVFNLSTGGVSVGASGAIFGVLGAFVALYPKEKVWFPLIIIRPWPVWVIAFIYFGLETMFAASGYNLQICLADFGIDDARIDHFAHLGGLLSALVIAPIIGKFKVEREKAVEEGIVDLTELRKLAKTSKLKDIYLRIKKEDKPEIRNVWIEEFMNMAKCPKCGGEFNVKRGKAKCSNCGYKIKY
jgi:membrane associated rhomboid family serine protease